MTFFWAAGSLVIQYVTRRTSDRQF